MHILAQILRIISSKREPKHEFLAKTPSFGRKSVSANLLKIDIAERPKQKNFFGQQFWFVYIPGSSADHARSDVLLVAVLDVHHELARAVAAAAGAARQQRLPPRRRLGLVVQVLRLLQLVLPRLQKK